MAAYSDRDEKAVPFRMIPAYHKTTLCVVKKKCRQKVIISVVLVELRQWAFASERYQLVVPYALVLRDKG